VLRLVEAEELALAAGDGNSVQAAGGVPLDQFGESSFSSAANGVAVAGTTPKNVF
jgi:hypothetical protein